MFRVNRRDGSTDPIDASKVEDLASSLDEALAGDIQGLQILLERSGVVAVTRPRGVDSASWSAKADGEKIVVSIVAGDVKLDLHVYRGQNRVRIDLKRTGRRKRRVCRQA